MTYNLLNISSNTVTPYMLNPGAWAWGAKAGFFAASICPIFLVFSLVQIPETKERTYAELNVLFTERTNAWKFANKQVNIINNGHAEKEAE